MYVGRMRGYKKADRTNALGENFHTPGKKKNTHRKLQAIINSLFSHTHLST